MFNVVHTKVAECQRQILEAGEMVEEANRSLGLDVDGIKDGDAFWRKKAKKLKETRTEWSP